jgi:DNA (cytosine-5)-methyltransferase 1
MLPSAVAQLLPTPTASDRFGSGKHGDGGQDLRTTVSLLPTPQAHDGWSTSPVIPSEATAQLRMDQGKRKLVDELAVLAGSRNWGVYEPAIRRWESILGRPAPVPTIRGARGGRKLNPALPEFMMGFPEGWITDVPGISVNEALKLAGNAVCQQQAAAALRWLLPLVESERAA